MIYQGHDVEWDQENIQYHKLLKITSNCFHLLDKLPS